jgi:hypothetical protein
MATTGERKDELVPNVEQDTAPPAVTPGERLRARRWVGIALAATITGFVVGLGYVAMQGMFGWMSDLGAVAFAVALLPVAFHIHKEFRNGSPEASRVVWGIAVLGLSVLAISGAALAYHDATRTPPSLPVLDFQHLGIFLQGVWMMGVGVVGARTGVFRRKTSMAALISGLGYAGGAPVSLYMGFETPLFYLAFLVALVGVIVWSLSLRKDLRTLANES